MPYDRKGVLLLLSEEILDLVLVHHNLLVGVLTGDGILDWLNHLYKIPSGSGIVSPLGYLGVFGNFCHWMMILLLDFFVNSHFLQDRVVLLEFKPVRGILTVLLGHITGCAGKTGCFMLGTLEDDLEPVTF